MYSLISCTHSLIPIGVPTDILKAVLSSGALKDGVACGSMRVSESKY